VSIDHRAALHRLGTDRKLNVCRQPPGGGWWHNLAVNEPPGIHVNGAGNQRIPAVKYIGQIQLKAESPPAWPAGHRASGRGVDIDAGIPVNLRFRIAPAGEILALASMP
jgi:hypothetical protein